MADKELEEVYREKSEKYERMVAREDYQNNIYRAIMQIRDLHGLDVIDTGAGILSGWSVVYTVVWSPENWREELEKALKELQRVLRPGGTLIILETNGTGYETPTPPADLLEYFRYLDGAGFQYTWIRTDYQFESMEEGKDLTTFFFGDAIVEKFSSTDPAILPECTGIWWKQF